MRLRLMLMSLSAAAALLAATGAARADTLRSGENGPGTQAIGKGVKELGVETLFLLGYDKVGDASALRLTLFIGPTFRYFVNDNVALAINVSGFFKRESATAAAQSDFGVLGTIGANYYARLGGGMFFVPGIGVGGFFGKRANTVTTPAVGTAPATSTELDSTLVGGTGRVGFGLTYYASSSFALQARPEALISFGKATPDAGGDGQTFIGIDGGFNVGMSYVF